MSYGKEIHVSKFFQQYSELETQVTLLMKKIKMLCKGVFFFILFYYAAELPWNEEYAKPQKEVKPGTMERKVNFQIVFNLQSVCQLVDTVSSSFLVCLGHLGDG